MASALDDMFELIDAMNIPEGYRAEMAAKARFTNKKPVAPRESHDSKQIYFGADGAHEAHLVGGHAAKGVLRQTGGRGR